MSGFGTLAWMAKETAAGRDLPEDVGDILYAGISSSMGGILPGLGVDYLAHYVGINGGGAQYVGYQSLLEKAVGPTAGFMRNLDGASDLLPGGDKGDSSDLKYLWKLMPLNNHPLSKQIEKSITE